ncbi:hypothetical protein PM082_016655 [Marasmius tenuissimus]|nr:hypothetical protein PM082_016655 [Marasmius tenuissimus]
MHFLRSPLVVASGVATLAQGKMFHWPNRQMDWVDTVLYETAFFENITLNCLPRDNTTVGAQWVRLGFHDMATHNIDDGTGGLDGSILYELDRPENIGMNRTMGDFVGFGTRFFGLADLIAAGVVVGTFECGGPVIPYRAGRADANGPGNTGTPEPQHDLKTLVESFRKQGFTQSEMIAVTACGHALGGVTQQDFPDILKDRAFQRFNEKTTSFTNDVVTQYLDGTTPNPLVVGTNTTMNSDLRIFSSDGNATIKSLTSPEEYSKTCATLFEKMINTVPSSVTLTEAIVPWDYKVGEARLAVANGTDKLIMTTTLRLLNAKENRNREVKLVWVDRDGSCSQGSCSSIAASSAPINGTKLFTKGYGKTGIQYNFALTDIDPVKSIGKFWFEIDEKDGSQVTTVKNDDGNGYVISQDDILFDVTRSTFFTNLAGTNFTADIVVAVKDELAGKAPINLETAKSFTLPYKYQVVEAKEDSRFPKTAGYTFFSTRTPEELTSAFDIYYGDVKPENLKVLFGQVFEGRNVVLM